MLFIALAMLLGVSLGGHDVLHAKTKTSKKQASSKKKKSMKVGKKVKQKAKRKVKTRSLKSKRVLAPENHKKLLQKNKISLASSSAQTKGAYKSKVGRFSMEKNDDGGSSTSSSLESLSEEDQRSFHAGHLKTKSYLEKNAAVMFTPEEKEAMEKELLGASPPEPPKGLVAEAGLKKDPDIVLENGYGGDLSLHQVLKLHEEGKWKLPTPED